MREIGAVIVYMISLVSLATRSQGAEPVSDLGYAPGDNLVHVDDPKRARMKWWADARFGMFIHWGPDAVPSLQWKGVYWNGHVPQLGERHQIPLYPAHESILNIPRTDWEDDVIVNFNPTAYDPEAWVKMAKEAGMKYVVLTTKHHNGFLMWPGLAGYDIRETQFGGDPVAMFVEACRKHGMKIGFYYSQLDWHDPDAIGNHVARTFPDGWIVNPEKFIPRVKSQIKDLLTRYGKIDLLWFDGQWIDDWTMDMANDLEAFIRNLQPHIIINNRIGKSEVDGDYFTPEQTIPATGVPDAYWETCMTMNDTWFYVKQDNNWKTAKVLIQQLVDAASKGGNYLLNVGPDPLGRFPAASIARLDTIGKWMSINSEGIYGAAASPFPQSFDWGRVTKKGSILYLHVFTRPIDGNVWLPDIGYTIKHVHALSDRKKRGLAYTSVDNGIRIEVPDHPETHLPIVIKITS